MASTKVAALAELSPKQLPSFYCAYLLRSTVRPSSTYIGSTPDPRRRINQHNGITLGGARRTKKNDLRPWEMTVIVHGFASQIAALQFEWAWQNSHKSKKIEDEDRAAVTATKSRAGAKPTKRKSKPRASMQLHLKNLLLLVTGKAFVRWGLRIRFFCQDVYEAWEGVVEQYGDGRRIPKVLIDRRMVIEESDQDSGDEVIVPGSQISELTGRKNKHKGDGKGGVLGLDITNEHVLPHLRKSHELLTSPSPPVCHFCHESNKIPAFKSLLTCPTSSCKLAAHIHCFSRHFLSIEGVASSEVLPDCATCPSCNSLLEWVDLIREYKLRLSTTLPKKKVAKVTNIKKESTTASKVTKTKAGATTKGAAAKAKSRTDSIIDAILKEEEDYAPLAPVPYLKPTIETKDTTFESSTQVELTDKDEAMRDWIWQEPNSDEEMIFEDSLKYGGDIYNDAFEQDDDNLDDTWEDKIDEVEREGSVQPSEDEEIPVVKKKRGRPPKRLSTVPEDIS